MTRPFVMWPHKALRSVADDVHEITDETRAIWDEMIDAMEAMPGVGLAAVQLGIMQRLAVVDASEDRGQAVCKVWLKSVILSGFGRPLSNIRSIIWPVRCILIG